MRSSKKFVVQSALVVFGLLAIVLAPMLGDLSRENVRGCKVLDLESLQLINKSGTEFRYLVITDKGTFICGKSVLNGQYDASNTFFRLKEGEVYDFYVCGPGKGFFFDYKTILEVKKQK